MKMPPSKTQAQRKQDRDAHNAAKAEAREVERAQRAAAARQSPPASAVAAAAPAARQVVKNSNWPI